MMKTKRGVAFALALVLSAGTAHAAATWTYSDWDSDGNLELTEREFTAGIAETGIYANWDADRDEIISEDEFNRGLYQAWNTDDEPTLTATEFEEGWGNWYDTGIPDYTVWDANADSVLDEEEFAAGVGETGLYDTWDADETAGIGEDEFYGGLYDTWDADDDEIIAEGEWYEEDDDWLF